MPKFNRKMAILVVVEPTSGVDAVPTGAANAILCSDATITPIEGDVVERNNYKPFFGNSGNKMVTFSSKISFSVEIAGAGAAGTVPKYAPLLRGCSISSTTTTGTKVTFAPITDNAESVTIYGVLDGVLHKMVGARGTVKAQFDAKGLPKWQFEFTGLFVPLQDVAAPSPVYTGFIEPLGVNKTNTTAALHGVPVAASSFAWDCGNTVVKRDLMTVDSVQITDRKSTGSITFELTDVATKNWVGLAAASTSGAFQLVHGTVAGNIVEFNGPNVQLGKPSYADSDGVQMITVPLGFNSSTAGNDEWSIVVR